VAGLADAARERTERLAVPDACEGDVLAAMMDVIFRGGGDFPLALAGDTGQGMGMNITRYLHSHIFALPDRIA
jgi:hypothetical protein